MLGGFNGSEHDLNQLVGDQTGTQSSLQLDELQKVFELFHMNTESIEEPVPKTSLQRLQARELPRPHGS